MKNGVIEIGSDLAVKIGFTEDKFEGYLWKKGNEIWISFIVSKKEKRGNLKLLFDTIEYQGYKIVVPTPFHRMALICEKRGMVKGTRKSDGAVRGATVNVYSSPR